ncbi:App1 family protein [bacterium]|nr:App1 family protein [bacterium]
MRSIFLILILLFSQFVSAKTLVISDIDDTLRWTQRVGSSLFEQLDKAKDPELIVYGMNDVLNTFDKNNAKIFYVTAAVSPLDKLSQNFLEQNSFPQRNNFINKGWFEDTEKFKVKTISKIIKNERPDAVILIGDNGEADSAAYAQIAKNFANVSVFIHKIYEHSPAVQVPQDQFIFLTAADLATTLEGLQIFAAAESQFVLQNVQSYLAADLGRDLILPNWLEITEEDVARVKPTKTVSPLSQQIWADVFSTLKLL